MQRLAAAQITPDLETPQYSVLRKAPEYEIRRYEGYMVAETSMPANTGPAGGTGFQELASYIFSGNSRCAIDQANTWRISMRQPELLQASPGCSWPRNGRCCIRSSHLETIACLSLCS